MQIYLIFDICSRKYCFESYMHCFNKIKDSFFCNLIYVCITCESCGVPTRETGGHPERPRRVVVPIE